jgi:hypothetical protein
VSLATYRPRPDDIEVGDGLDAIFELNEHAERLGWRDGLPIMPATVEAVGAMLETVEGDPADVVARLPPSQAPASLEKLAACAVMAGCRPEHFPVVVAAIRGFAVREFGLQGINVTTNPVAPMVVVNGPLRHELGINCEHGLMGPGHRANATIGRAVSLAMINLAGRIPGTQCKTTHASPGRYTFCIGENEEASPWEPLHVEKGFAAGDGCVTVMAPSGTTNIVDMACRTAEGLLKTMASSMMAIGSVNLNPFSGLGPMIVVVGPDHAARFAAAGWTKQDVKERLFEETKGIPLEAWPEEFRQHMVDSGRVRDSCTWLAHRPDQFEIVVAGGSGGFCSVFLPTFGDSWPNTRVVERRAPAARSG